MLRVRNLAPLEESEITLFNSNFILTKDAADDAKSKSQSSLLPHTVRRALYFSLFNGLQSQTIFVQITFLFEGTSIILTGIFMVPTSEVPLGRFTLLCRGLIGGMFGLVLCTLKFLYNCHEYLVQEVYLYLRYLLVKNGRTPPKKLSLGH